MLEALISHILVNIEMLCWRALERDACRLRAILFDDLVQSVQFQGVGTQPAVHMAHPMLNQVHSVQFNRPYPACATNIYRIYRVQESRNMYIYMYHVYMHTCLYSIQTLNWGL